MILDNDFDALRAGIKTAPEVDEKNMRIVRIKNTLRLDQFQVSEAIAKEILENKEEEKSKQLILNEEGFYWSFDEEGKLVTGWEG